MRWNDSIGNTYILGIIAFFQHAYAYISKRLLQQSGLRDETRNWESIFKSCFAGHDPAIPHFKQMLQDLTQLTFGISRDDAQAKFLTFYRQHGLLPSDPFESIDEVGVGELVSNGMHLGKAALAVRMRVFVLDLLHIRVVELK